MSCLQFNELYCFRESYVKYRYIKYVNIGKQTMTYNMFSLSECIDIMNGSVSLKCWQY